MPKYLFLFRHAEAVQKLSFSADKERQLTTKGLNQAVQIGAQLKAHAIQPEIIFASTADRAKQTVTLAADTMQFDASKIIFEDDIYDASTRTLFNYVSNIEDNYSNVMIVGHNPTLTYLAEYLTQEAIGDMNTATIVLIRFNLEAWKEISQGNGELVKHFEPISIDNN